MTIRNIIKRIVYGHKANSASYVKYLRKLGMKIGDDVTIYAPTKTVIDTCYPWLLSIGNHVRITEGVVILNHDYSWSVLKDAYGPILGSSGSVTIGNNVFIGMNAIITCGISIGDNVIIGAGSVVKKDCLESGVYAGNPAKYICDLESFLNKRLAVQLQEAKNLGIEYYKSYEKKPPEEVFYEYFPLFKNADSALKKDYSRKMMELGNGSALTLRYMEEKPAVFNGYDDFWHYCMEDFIN